ncbi:unnamed protein product [Toxocara canis]|uniref:UPF0528 protein n=1 Tax=Toxocara canis TaxID=6265 RepID=A0A183UFD5_TOXCA|nr:unnamed protein product [Toxocara canis]
MDMANEQTSRAERRSENDVEPSRPTDHSKTLKDFGYHFDGDGIMKDEAGNGFIFVDQKSYEAIGEAVTEEIYSILGRPPYNLCRTYFGAASERNEQSFIYHSKDFDEQKYLVVLIHGKGVVRAGQWARRLIINESLDRGSQLPYLRECAKRGWGVLVMNTNHNTFVDAQGHRKPFKGSGSAVEHGITVWKEFVTPSKAVRIAVVAHSAGGMVISKIMEEPSCWPRGDEEKARVGCICLTDSFFDAPSLGQMCEGTRPRVRHWVAYPSHQIGAPLPSSDYVERVTAGTNVHEETSPVAVDDIFKFIETTFRSYREKE